MKGVLLGTLGMMLLVPLGVSAQVDVAETVTNTVGGVVQKEFESQTGLDKLKDIRNIDAGKLADKTVEYIRGDVPSPLMGNLLQQLGADGSFKLWTIKTQNGSAPYYANACQRLANNRLWSGLFNTRVKAHFSPWVDIAWGAIKDIAGGGKSIADLVAENTKAKVEAMIKESLFGKAAPKVEVVTIPHHDSCNTVSTVTWDPINMRIMVVTKGNCGCALLQDGSGGSDTLGAFEVVLIADVTVEQVKVEEKNRFIFWRTYTVQAEYKVHTPKVTTKADCGCATDQPPPPEPPEPPQDGGFITGIIGWLTDWFEGPQDETEEEKDDQGDPQENDESNDAPDEQKDTTDGNVRGGIFGWFTGKNDDTTDNEPKGDDDQREDATDQPQTQKLQCGDPVSIDGRSSVKTYPYTDENRINAVSQCNGQCAAHQECRIVPKSQAFPDSCTYCHNVCKEGQFTNVQACTAARGSNQECVSAGASCFALQNKKSAGTQDCEKAVRMILDQELGFFDPPLTVSAHGAVFLNDQRCADDAEFVQYHKDPIARAATEAKIKALCPSLSVDSSELIHISGGAKGLCQAKTVFSF